MASSPFRSKSSATDRCAQTGKRSSSQMGLSSVVDFSGWLSQEACAARLRDADVLVLPSLYECGGAVVLEAMAMGLPVIATAWGGPIDYLDSSCGILVKPDSRESLIAGFSDAMTKLATSPDLRIRLGRAGYARARENFDWERKIDQILEIYALAMKSRTDKCQRPSCRLISGSKCETGYFRHRRYWAFRSLRRFLAESFDAAVTLQNAYLDLEQILSVRVR